jgi:arylsulfatase A-like enzyme
VRCPGKLPAGKRISGLARMFDLAPTILDFLGLSELAQEANMEGSSLLSLVKSSRGRKKEVCSELFLTECTWMRKRGIRTREWKYIRSSEPDIHNRPPKELYHLVDDQGELKNLADEMPEIVKELEGRLMDWVRRRLDRTKKVDPIETQGITLRAVRLMTTAVPENQKL